MIGFRCIGVLKSRFRCILRERSARYNPEFVGRITNVCAVLHNMCVAANIPPPAENHLNHNNVIVLHEIQDPNTDQAGQRKRSQVVLRYFS